MFFLQSITMHAKRISDTFNKTTSISKRMTVTALLAALAVILQSAGGFIPVIGLFISPFATAPMILSTVLSARFGFLGYILTAFLLFIIQPSEVLIFTCTTGLLGIGIGFAYHICQKRLTLIMTGAIVLLSGILIVLFIFQFPILGPAIDPSTSIQWLLPLILFSCLYSWIWVEISIFLFKRLTR
jgi:membrane-associated HD superfamily phosphohydrolase